MSGKNHFINNTWIEGTGTIFRSNDPATGEIIWQGRTATAKEIDLAVFAANNAFQSWAGLSLQDRVNYLQTFRDRLSASTDRLAESISRETGKPKWESLSEVNSMIAKIAVTVESYHDRCRTKLESISGTATITQFKPLGVVAVLGPFNMPCHLPNGHIVPAILAGNTVVFKPSSQAPLVAELMIELWEASGVPNGVINLVQGGSVTGKALSEHPDLDGLFFTGSESVGKDIHRAFGGHPEKILVLEMGGNNPLVIYKVSNPQAAAYLTVISAYITAGQRCSCARRVIVPKGADGDNFVECLLETVRKIKVGHYTDLPEPFMGPVISTQSAEQLLAIQRQLVNQGGKALVEMRSHREMGAMLSPGIVDVTSIKNREDTELFGPLLQLIRVPDFDLALIEANNTSYGLTAGLLCDDLDLYEEFRRSIRAGVVNWNRQTTGASSRMPFGGVGSSGNHRPGAYFMVDHCVYPVASIEAENLSMPASVIPGLWPD